ncbi:MAG: PcfJ domain-containing protein [Microthrixaceae bacterium]
MPGESSQKPTRTTTDGPKTGDQKADIRGSVASVDVSIGERRILVLTPLDGHVRIGLAMPGIDRVVDLSSQPSAVIKVLREAAATAGTPWGQVEKVMMDAIAVAAESSGAVLPSGCLPSGTLAAAAFPLLAQAFTPGSSQDWTIPNWAEPILASRTIADATRVAFGDKSTKSVRRAMALSLRPDGAPAQMNLDRLALALMGRDVLQPDRIARVLTAGHVDQSGHRVDTTAIKDARRVVVRWGDVRCESVLTDAAGDPSGIDTLLATIAYAQQLKDDGPADPLPNRLAELHDSYRVLMRTATVRITPDASAQQSPLPDAPHHVLASRTGRQRLDPSVAIDYPTPIAALNGMAIADMRLVLPRTTGDLTRWGRILSNCLDSYDGDAVRGISYIIGIHRNQRLTYAVEVTQSGVLRQFNGHANRRPRSNDRDQVVSALLEAGVIDRRQQPNRPWIESIPA